MRRNTPPLIELLRQRKKAKRSKKIAKIIAKAVEVRKRPLGSFSTQRERTASGQFVKASRFIRRIHSFNVKLTQLARRQEQVEALTKKSRELSSRRFAKIAKRLRKK